MQAFQKNILSLLTIIMIIVLIFIGYELMMGPGTADWPPTKSPCPAYYEDVTDLSTNSAPGTKCRRRTDVRYNKNSTATFASAVVGNVTCEEFDGNGILENKQFKLGHELVENCGLLWDDVSSKERKNGL